MTLAQNTERLLASSVWCAPGEALQKEEALTNVDILVQALVWDKRHERASLCLGKAQGLVKPPSQ
jgi:hypothetical protein